MGDLISRKALLQKVVEANPMGGMIGGKFVEDLIKSEPIAYDVDKVVEQLTEGLDSILYNRCYEVDYRLGTAEVNDLLKIVLKGAVKDESNNI
jgi:hypothetical protein